MRPFEKSESSAHNSNKGDCWAVLNCQAKIPDWWEQASVKAGKNLTNDVLGEQWDSMGQIVRLSQDQAPNLLFDTCNTLGETSSAQNRTPGNPMSCPTTINKDKIIWYCSRLIIPSGKKLFFPHPCFILTWNHKLINNKNLKKLWHKNWELFSVVRTGLIFWFFLKGITQVGVRF